MPELKEVFEMVSQKVEPEFDAWSEQEHRQRRTAMNRRIGAIAVVAVIVGALVMAALTMPGNDRTKNVGTDPRPTDDVFPGPIGAQIVDLNGTVVRDLPAQVSLGEQPQLSPDGTTIAYYRSDAVWTIGIDGDNERQLTPSSNDLVGAKSGVSWSRDGTQLVYAWNSEIWIMNADGSGKRQLTHSPDGMGSYAPTWSFDGHAIAFWRGTSVSDNDAPDDSEIYFIGPGGGRAFRLTHDDHASFQPAYSLDGSQIAYRRHDPDDIVVMDSDGTNAHAVAPDAWNPWSPAWSWDGTKLAILRCCADHDSFSGRPLLEVAVIDLSTHETQRLGLYVETENNVPQWVSPSTLLVNRQE
jgi:Tol biopolymer transport system component